MTTPDINEIRIDEQGHVDRAAEEALAEVLAQDPPTDVVVFSHGWNNSVSMASKLYADFLGPLDKLLATHGVPDRKVAYIGVFWPSMMWTDEPIPDFPSGDAVDLGAGAGPAAGIGAAETFAAPPPPDPQLQGQIVDALPAQVSDSVRELLTLLESRPDDQTSVDRARELVRSIAVAALPDGDGEQDGRAPAASQPDPANKLFDDFASALEELNVDTGDSGAAAGLGEVLGRLWSGAQQVLRTITYWQMKKRAGVVGEIGLGPMLARLSAAHPGVRINLIGHSFGGRVVSYALKGFDVPVGAAPPVQSITLLQGAFSHFAFAAKLPMDETRPGALFGQQDKVAGPVVACYSRFDSAVGVMYPLASLAVGDDAAALVSPAFRFGGMGHDGHQQGVTELRLLVAPQRYDFNAEKLINIDASRVVRKGWPPAGAHSDIVHDELAWVVANAAGLAPV